MSVDQRVRGGDYFYNENQYKLEYQRKNSSESKLLFVQMTHAHVHNENEQEKDTTRKWGMPYHPLTRRHLPYRFFLIFNNPHRSAGAVRLLLLSVIQMILLHLFPLLPTRTQANLPQVKPVHAHRARFKISLSCHHTTIYK